MAQKQITLKYNLKQMNNDSSSANLQWFPTVVRTDTLSLRGLSDHIAEHGSIYTQDVVHGVLQKFTSCMVELIKQGIAVKLDGLGTFFPTIEAKGANTPVGYNIQEYAKGVHIRFTPEGCELDRITSRELMKQASFSQMLIIDKNHRHMKVKDGQLVPVETPDDDD